MAVPDFMGAVDFAGVAVATTSVVSALPKKSHIRKAGSTLASKAGCLAGTTAATLVTLAAPSLAAAMTASLAASGFGQSCVPFSKT
ncbi:hypothetical protein D3C86_1982710 [compost metagenome]